jgi:hypothetical protein
VVSRGVLEHIPETVLEHIIRHSASVLTPDGYACHTIDLSDHWEHCDKSISRVNFLQYDGLAWKFAGLNPQNFQNRLRRFEYVDLLARNNFKILSASGDPHQGALKALETLPLCVRYRNVPHHELAVMGAQIIAQVQGEASVIAMTNPDTSSLRSGRRPVPADPQF